MEWAALDRHERYRMLIRAVDVLTIGHEVYSHASAAALWRLPFLGAWPAKVQVSGPPADGGRSTAKLARHYSSAASETEMIDGLEVTSLCRTAVDLARSLPFADAVVVLDAALRRGDRPVPDVPRARVTREQLGDELARLPSRQGSARARRAIGFADAAADRPGESLSRVNIHLSGLSAPLLQVPLRGASGRQYFVDFYWPQFRTIGEFDGRSKYEDPAFLRGRSPQRVLVDEKIREDDLRAAGHSMCRWMWEDAESASRLKGKLLAVGVR